LLYLAVAYGLTWLVWLPYLRAAVSDGSAPGPFLYYLAAVGPFLGAFAAELYERGREGVADLVCRLIALRRTGWWVAVGIGSALLLLPLATVLIVAATGDWPAWDQVGISDRAPGLGPAATWVLMTVSYGVGEEVGWRGFLLPRLQAERPALVATLVLTPIWAAWHLPAFWFREGYVGLGVGGTIGFVASLAAGAIVLTALYNSSGGSILAVALWHGTWNWLATSDGLEGAWVAVMSAIIMVGALIVVWRLGTRNLAPGERPTVRSRDTIRISRSSYP